MFGRVVSNGNIKAHRRESAGRNKLTMQQMALKEVPKMSKVLNPSSQKDIRLEGTG